LASQSHLRPNSRIVGYGTALVVGLLTLFFSWRIFVYTQLERDHAWVHFTGSGDLIGSLQEDDPVAIQGVTVGQVEEILSVRDGVRVKLRFWKHQKLWQDASASNVGNGLMGMRFVLLKQGIDTLHPLDRYADVPGRFNPGIAEVMSGIKEVVAKVQLIQDRVTLLAKGDSSRAPIARDLMQKVQDLDNLLGRMENLDRKIRPAATKAQSMARFGLVTARGLDSATPGILKGLRQTDTALVKARDIIATLRSLSRDADTAVQRTAAPLEPFTRNDSLLRKIQSTLVIVDQLQDFIDGKTKLKYNFHVLGDNPSKHGE